MLKLIFNNIAFRVLTGILSVCLSVAAFYILLLKITAPPVGASPAAPLTAKPKEFVTAKVPALEPEVSTMLVSASANVSDEGVSTELTVIFDDCTSSKGFAGRPYKSQLNEESLSLDWEGTACLSIQKDSVSEVITDSESWASLEDETLPELSSSVKSIHFKDSKGLAQRIVVAAVSTCGTEVSCSGFVNAKVLRGGETLAGQLILEGKSIPLFTTGL